MSDRSRTGTTVRERTPEAGPTAARPSGRQTFQTVALAVIATLLAVLVVDALASDGSGHEAATTPAAGTTAAANGAEEGPGTGIGATADQGGPLVPFAGDPAGAVGAADAPVVMEVWSDFSCPYCGAFAGDTQPLLLSRYVETGQVRVEFHDFPAQGQPSLDAAVAARAAGRQDAYVAYADRLYANQTSFDRGDLLIHAEALGLDLGRFEADLDDPVLERAVRSDWLAGQQAGVRATPSFVIDRRLLAGAHPVEQFEVFIDHFLSGSG